MSELEQFKKWAASVDMPDSVLPRAWMAWQASAARAQPAQAAPITSESGNQAAQEASAITSGTALVLTYEEIAAEIRDRGPWLDGARGDCFIQGARWAERAVRAKLRVAVPMTKQLHKANGGGDVHPALISTDEWFEFWDNCDNVDGESIFPEFLCLAQDIEQLVLAKVGTVGKESV